MQTAPVQTAPRGHVHELILDRAGAIASVRGIAADALDDRLGGLVALARRAGRMAGPLEISFFWRSPDERHVFATVRSPGHNAPTSLTWDEDSAVPYGVTARELEVLTLIIGGLTNVEIAARLWTSPRTVSTHVERLLAKLEVASRAGAAGVALEESLYLLPVPGGAHGFERLLLGALSAGPDAEALAPSPSGQGWPPRRPAPPPTTRRRALRRPILLGGAFPLTGQAAEDGVEMVRATELAIDEVNQRGGIAGRSVELVSVDLDLNDGSSIRRAFDDLAGADVDAMVSGYLGDQAVAHEAAADHGAPYLHAATLDSMVRRVGENPERYGNVFQVCPSDTNYGPGFVHAMTWLRDSGQLRAPSRSLAVVRGRWKLGDLAIPAAVELAERNGWTVDYVADDVHGVESWQEQGRRIAELAPAAVLIGSYFVSETVAFCRAFGEDPSPTVLYSLYAPSIPAFRTEMGPQAEGLLWATTTGTYSDQVARQFIERYRGAWAATPGRSHAGIAYDRVRILAGAWAAAGSPRDFDAVNRAIRGTVHRGVNGAYSFTDAGQSVQAYPLATPDPSISMAHLVFQIQDNRQRIVYPTPYTEAAFREPPWARGRLGG